MDHCKPHGWDFVSTAPNAAVKHIIAVLQPAALKSSVEYALRLEKNHPQNIPGRSTPPSDKPAVILAELNGYRFACRIDSGADAVAISDTILKYLGDKGFFLPTMLPTNGKHVQGR